MHDPRFEHFLDEGLVTDVIRVVKTGKEASVFLCRAGAPTGRELAALKAYHPYERRDFRDDDLYRDGEYIKEHSVRKAVAKRSRFGREAYGGIWVNREWEALRDLSAAGAPVPSPIARTDDAILMSYVGDADQPAPQLRSVRPRPDEASELFRQVLRGIETMLAANVIHGDLSPYNVLVWRGRATVIDLPQAVDPRKNRFAEELLRRDVENVGRFFARLGVENDPERIAGDLWTSWTFADLVPGDLSGRAPDVPAR